MRIPEFTEEAPTDCSCGFCTGARVADKYGGHRPRCTVRGAVVAAVGAAVLVGTGAGTASAEPAPSHAGWDGTKYWFKNSAGEWRWTSYKSKYDRYTGNSSASRPSSSGSSSSSSSASSSSSSGHNTSPTFRGRSGWDATDRVYWYQRNGQWWWTSHRNVYEARTGKSGATGGGSASSGSSGSSAGSGSSGKGTPSRHGTESAIGWAMSQLGKPYSWGGNGPNSYDCSGLVQQAYRRAGISVPRVADAQYRAGTPISRSQLRRGDLVFWSSSGSSYGIHHVAIYLGNGQYLEAPRPGKNVRVSSFSYYNPNMYARVG
ncbi:MULTISPECIES: C40 family peptidase [Streptomyces]|uniref:C40 family peptidase n=1 Tax=Streptomyces TaxID=1883 RepID=UPI000B9EAF24|nr:C40 family peptidase [Streptomyces kasugaensis]WSK12878.1 C40 family peptidase [Streptomyces celluloflavus]